MKKSAIRLPDLSDLVQDLQLAKDMAIKGGNVTGLVSATMAQAKLLGLDKPIVVSDVHGEVQSLCDLMDELASDNSGEPIT